jgi:transposase InsO family protein
LCRRGPARQQPQRLLEQTIRLGIVNFSAWTSAQGWTLDQTASILGLLPRTLRQWEADHRRGLGLAQPLGRPTRRSPVGQRNQVIELLDELGPGLGVPTLRHCFPGMARAELDDLLKRYRRVWRQRHCQALRVLHWQRPGSVWAMDFAEPPTPIDGLHSYLLAVRDLASGQQLLWLPIAATTAAETLAALASLFALHGAPLVVKTDNGSAFGARGILEFLDKAGVLPLFSPPYWPRYNGAIEAGIGSLKTRTEQHASRRGRLGQWTWDDVECARLQANATARPHGATGPTPDKAWSWRHPLSGEERVLFHEAVERHHQLARAEVDYPSEGVQEQRALHRLAIRRALEEHAYLLYSRRRILLPITKTKVANIQ